MTIPDPLARHAGRWTDPSPVPAVRIRLSDERPAPAGDPLGRSYVGFAASLTAEELWERARGVWKTKLASLAESALVVIVYNDVVVGVATMDAIRPVEDRVIIEGRAMADHPLIGEHDPLPNTSRNPITYGAVDTVRPVSTPPRTAAAVLDDAIAVLTEAGRLRRPMLRPVGVPADGDLRNVGWAVDPDRTEQADWAELVTLALAGAAANLGGIEAALAGRPGSWEASRVRDTLESTLGADEQNLWEHRTEPLTITLPVEDLVLDNAESWSAAYDAAPAAIFQMVADAEAVHPPIDPTPYMWRYRRTVADGVVGPWEPEDPSAPAWSIEAWRAGLDGLDEGPGRSSFEQMMLGDLGQDADPRMYATESYVAKTPELAAEYARLDDEREAAILPVAMLEEQLDAQRAREIADYGQALKARIEAAASALPGLSVPVRVELDLDYSARLQSDDAFTPVDRLIEQAMADTPTLDDLPGTPLSRLLEAAGIELPGEGGQE